MPVEDCASGRATLQKLASSFWQVDDGTTVRSSRRLGSTSSTSSKIDATEGQSHGYLWWLGRARAHGRDIRVVGAFGRGGQYIRIVPELGLVVAVTAGYYQDYSREAFDLQYSVFSDVLRAIPAT
jgi:CubicO group peptidase (beta-lactamase class C family)